METVFYCDNFKLTETTGKFQAESCTELFCGHTSFKSPALAKIHDMKLQLFHDARANEIVAT